MGRNTQGRNHPYRLFATSVLSSTLMLVSLSGCGTAKKAGPQKFSGGLEAPAYTSSISSGKKSQRLKQPSTIGHLPQKISPLAAKATRLSKAFGKNPANSKVAMQYVYHLRALGMQQQAMNVLHKAYQANPTEPTIASEYGRLLLGTGKTLQARRVLNRVASRTTSDWRTLSALGTIEARDEHYKKAIHYYRAAYKLAPKQVSVINNLALSMALDGHPDKAEKLLRNADDSGRFGTRLRQNLALVLALQGKYDEAQAMATTDLPPKIAEQNIAYLKTMLATSESRDGIEISDETVAPVARKAPHSRDAAPATTASLPTAHKTRKRKPKSQHNRARQQAHRKAAATPVSFGPPTSLVAPGLRTEQNR